MQKVKSIIRLIGGLFLLLSGFLVWNMHQRIDQSLLWGHRPLWFYLSLYLGLLLVFFPFQGAWLKFKATDGALSKNNRIFLATLAGLLFGFGFPGFLPLPCLLLVAFIPLLILHKDLSTNAAPKRAVFFYGFHSFVLFNILATYWVTNTAFAPGVFAILANSLLMCIPWMLFHYTAKRLPKVAYLSLPAYWLCFEWFHFNWELNWPWLTLGNGFAQFPSWIQWYEYTGALGGTVWILATNLILFRAFFQDFKVAKQPLAAKQLLLPATVILLPLAFSLLRYSTYQAPTVGTIQVAAIQPNFEPHFEKFAVQVQTQLDTFIPLTEAALAAVPELDYALYPETSFSNVQEESALEHPGLSQLLRQFQGSNLKYLVTGYDGYHIFGPGEPRTPAVRSFDRPGGRVLELEAINGTVQIDLASGDYQTYRKGVFVPGAESFPFRDYLFFAKPLVDALGGSVAGRGTQAERTPLLGREAQVAPVICYESVFGDYFTDYIKAGAQVIFVMTNDGWWDNTPGHRQHLWFSSLRAIETRRDVVRSANMGACAFIDQRGKVLSQTPYGKMGFLTGTMQLNNYQTFYVQYGDYLARIAGLLSIMLLLSALTRGRFKRA